MSSKISTIIMSAFILASTLFGCTKAIDELAEIHYNQAILKTSINELNKSLEVLSDIVMNLTTEFIASISPIEDNDEIIGYTLQYNGGKTVDIMLGKDGKDGENGRDGFNGSNGKVPKLGVEQGEDGAWYWTLNGRLYLDENGQKVMASGGEASIPKMKIEGGYWYVSYNNGITWTRLSIATATVTSIFESIDYTSSYDSVILHLTNGQIITIPRYIDLDVRFTQGTDMYVSSQTQSIIDFSAIGGKGDIDITVITSDGISYSIEKTTDETGRIRISCGKNFREGKVIITLRKNNQTFMKSYHLHLALEGLSKNGTANCYIVQKAGTYRFYALNKGNSNKVLDGTPVSARVLWESFGTSRKPSIGSIIKSISFDGEYVEFTTAMPMNEGNAVVAVYDDKGKILWSWHLWVTNYDPDQQSVVYLSAPGQRVMDRNLGALSSNPGTIEFMGLLYQWGRKDPFPNSVSYNESTQAATSIIWPSPVSIDETGAQLEYSISHPCTFITANDNAYMWCLDLEAAWNASKSEYDPCPPGWRVPDYDSNRWHEIREFRDANRNNPSHYYTVEEPYSIPQSHFPLQGYISYRNGSFVNVGYDSALWCSRTNGTNDYMPRFDGIYDSGGYYSSSIGNAAAVRCVKQ